MKLFTRNRKTENQDYYVEDPVTGDIHDLRPRHGPKSGPAVSTTHTTFDDIVKGIMEDRRPEEDELGPIVEPEWRLPRVHLGMFKFKTSTSAVKPAPIKNPKPYRGIVATRVAGKMIRENVQNTMELKKQGAHEQALDQLWSNFTKVCYAVGIEVDTNANLRTRDVSLSLA